MLALALFLTVSCGQEKGGQHYKVVVSCVDDPWHLEAVRSIERERYFYDSIELETRPVHTVEEQIADLDGLKTDEVDLLVISPITPWEVAPAIERIYDQGVPVILFDRKINSDKYSAFVSADNFVIGQQMGYYVESLLKDGGNVLLIRGNTSVTAEQERNDGFRAALSEDRLRNIIRLVAECIGDFGTAPARDAVMKTLQELPRGTRVDAVVAFNDNMAVGARQAFDSLHYQPVLPFILGVDALYGPGGGIDQVDRGNITASFIYPQGGKEIMELAAKILRGEPFDRYIPLQSTFVDKSNVRVVKIQREQMEQQQASIDQLNGVLSLNMARYADQRARTLRFAFFAVFFLLAASFLWYLYRRVLKSRRELDESNRSLRDLTRRLEEANQAKLNFFTNISHEFKTPLSLILNPLESLLDDKEVPAPERESIRMIQRNAGRLQDLINEILDYRRYENGALTTEYEAMDMDAFLRSINSLFSDVIRRKQVKFTYTATPDSYRMMLDKGKVEKIYFNLLSNAFKFVGDAGEVAVSTRLLALNGKRMVEISVFNSDSFIPEAELTEIFQRFYKIDSSRNESGTGIGLALAAAFTSVMQGEIFASSKEDVGTTFTFRLPFIPAEIPAGEDLSVAPAYTSPDLPWLASLPEEDYSMLNEVGDESLPGVLIIEDNADMRQYLKDVLGREYRVFLVEDGESGIRWAFRALPQIILCDIMMPGIKGYDVCRTLKKDARTKDIPIILLSACSVDEQIAEGYESGADAYIMKPFSAQILKVRMKKLIEKSEAIRKEQGNDWLVGNDKSLSRTQEQFLSDIKKYIEGRLPDNVNVQDMIDDFGMSKSKFYRKLGEITDYSPIDIANLIRIKAAMNLMLTRHKNISEAAAETGFSSTAYFSRVFSRYYKEPPTEWMKRNADASAG